MKYAIFSDVDGTIYSHDQKFHPKTKKDIAQAQKNGVEFVICTGNPFFEKMKKMTKELGVTYFVGSNGAFILDVKNQKTISLKAMPIESSQKIIDALNRLEIGGDWWDSEKLYANKYVNPTVREILQNAIAKSMKLVISDKSVEGIHKIEGYTEPNDEGIAKIDTLMKELEGMGLQLARMKPNHVEITMPKVSKGEALKELSSILEVPLSNTMSIGDSANDHSMLEAVEHSYAMANADELTKTKANLHTSSVEQNGLGEAIIDFMYRMKIEDKK